MAQLLVFKDKNWYEKQVELGTAKAELFDRMKGSPSQGDVWEVQEDGFWGDAPAHGYNKKVYAVVNVPGKRADYEYLMEGVDSVKDMDTKVVTYGIARIKKITNVIVDGMTINDAKDLIVEDKI